MRIGRDGCHDPICLYIVDKCKGKSAEKGRGTKSGSSWSMSKLTMSLCNVRYISITFKTLEAHSLPSKFIIPDTSHVAD